MFTLKPACSIPFTKEIGVPLAIVCSPKGLVHCSSNIAFKCPSRQFLYHNGTVNAVLSSTTEKHDKSWTSFLFNGQERIAAYEQNQKPLHYLQAHGSTGGTVSGEDTTSINYEPYGAQQPDIHDGAGLGAHQNFTWNQEYVDKTSNLVYLRARFYNPRLMRFMSHDTTPLFNRYAFGDGDPINMIDPTGLWSWQATLGCIFGGIAVAGGLLLTVSTAGIGLPALIAAATASPILFTAATGGLMGAGISSIAY